MYARIGTLTVRVFAPRVRLAPGARYPEMAGKRWPLSTPPIRSRRGVPLNNVPKFSEKPCSGDISTLAPSRASHVSGTDQCTVDPSDFTMSDVLFGLMVYELP